MKTKQLTIWAFLFLLLSGCAQLNIDETTPLDYMTGSGLCNITKETSVTNSSLFYHESTGLVLLPVRSPRLVEYNPNETDKDSIIAYALKVSPQTVLQQKQIEQMEGIIVSYIPFGYEPVSIRDADVSTLNKLPSDTQNIPFVQTIGKADNGRPATSLSGTETLIKIPSLYIEWPVSLPLPQNIDYEILYLIKRLPDQPKGVYPSFYNLVFQTYDPVLNSNVRLNKLKVRISKYGTTLSEQLTDSKGYMRINANQALYESEPMSYSITAVLSTPKWTITRETSITTPIHTALGTLSQYYDVNNPIDTIYLTLSSMTTEFEIHRAIDYYRNGVHELSNTILSDENSLMIAASDSTSLAGHGKEYWDWIVPDGANIVIYNHGLELPQLMGVIFHEIGHSRKDYAEGAEYYSTDEEKLIHESYASFIGYHLSRKYYVFKGYYLSSTDYEWFNVQHRQYWFGSGNYTPLFVDLIDSFNQGDGFPNFVYDSISGVPVLSVDRLGVFSNCMADFVSSIAPMVGVYFTQSQLDDLLDFYL